MAGQLELSRLGRGVKLAAVGLRDRWMLSDDQLLGRGRWPVRAAGSSALRAPFFVLGHPRSGTTLLRALLSDHPDVFIPPENDALWRMVRVFGGMRRAAWADVTREVTAAFTRGYEFVHWHLDPDSIIERLRSLPEARRTLVDIVHTLYFMYAEQHCPGKTVWGDKTTPGDFDYLTKIDKVFPGARYVHIVRDGRDCVVSGIKAGFFGKDYRAAARAWRDNVRTLERIGTGAGDRRSLLKLRYEDLVTDPEQELTRICEHIGVAFTDSMLASHGERDRGVPELHAVPHHANVARPIFSQSVGTWQSLLPDAVRAEVLEILAAELSAQGYH